MMKVARIMISIRRGGIWNQILDGNEHSQHRILIFLSRGPDASVLFTVCILDERVILHIDRDTPARPLLVIVLLLQPSPFKSVHFHSYSRWVMDMNEVSNKITFTFQPF